MDHLIELYALLHIAMARGTHHHACFTITCRMKTVFTDRSMFTVPLQLQRVVLGQRVLIVYRVGMLGSFFLLYIFQFIIWVSKNPSACTSVVHGVLRRGTKGHGFRNVETAPW